MFSAKMGKETDKTGYDFHSGYLRSRSMYAVIARSSRFFSFFRFWRFSDKPKFVTLSTFHPTISPCWMSMAAARQSLAA